MKNILLVLSLTFYLSRGQNSTRGDSKTTYNETYSQDKTLIKPTTQMPSITTSVAQFKTSLSTNFPTATDLFSTSMTHNNLTAADINGTIYHSISTTKSLVEVIDFSSQKDSSSRGGPGGNSEHTVTSPSLKTSRHINTTSQAETVNGEGSWSSSFTSQFITTSQVDGQKSISPSLYTGESATYNGVFSSPAIQPSVSSIAYIPPATIDKTSMLKQSSNTTSQKMITYSTVISPRETSQYRNDKQTSKKENGNTEKVSTGIKTSSNIVRIHENVSTTTTTEATTRAATGATTTTAAATRIEAPATTTEATTRAATGATTGIKAATAASLLTNMKVETNSTASFGLVTNSSPINTPVTNPPSSSSFQDKLSSTPSKGSVNSQKIQPSHSTTKVISMATTSTQMAGSAEMMSSMIASTMVTPHPVASRKITSSTKSDSKKSMATKTMTSSKSSRKLSDTIATKMTSSVVPSISVISSYSRNTATTALGIVTPWPSNTSEVVLGTSQWSSKASPEPSKTESMTSSTSGQTGNCTCSDWKYPANCKMMCCAGGQITATSAICMIASVSVSHQLCNVTKSHSCGDVSECACKGSQLSSFSYLAATMLVLAMWLT